jgi:hypothetical protein
MVCKYCGTTLKHSSTGNNVPVLIGRFGGLKCWQSSHGKHVGCSGESMICKYCGSNVKSSVTGNSVPILWASTGAKCPSSPHWKHELAE